MRKLLLLFIALAFVGCSVPEGAKGPEGEDGSSGEDGDNGKDGLDGHDGSDGQDGKDAIVTYKICKLNWPGQADSGSYDLTYTVMELASGAKHVDFNVVYKNQGSLSFAESASALLVGSTIVETANWKAEMADETNAIFSRKSMGQLKTVACQ